MNEPQARDFLAVERTHLANERTLLAYIRTGVALSAGGVALIELFPAGRWLLLVAWLLVLAGMFTVGFGSYRFRQVKGRINADITRQGRE